MKKLLSGLGLLLSMSTGLSAEPAQEVISVATDREATALTIYNDDLALVKERRRIALPAGLVRLSLREVSARLRPETVLLRPLSGPPISLVEQNFDFDLLTPAKLLEKYVGREVTVIRSHPSTGEDTREKATVLAANDGVVLRFADRVETGIPGRIAFGGVPPDLRDRPTLSILLESAGGNLPLELSYLAGGLSWSTDYVANLGADGKTMDLSGWVTLTNQSGTAYRDVTLQLVAGTLNRVSPPEVAMVRALAAPAPPDRKAGVSQESLADYHLYSFGRPTSIADRQTKQLALLSASAVPLRRSYLLAGGNWYYRQRHGQIGQKLHPDSIIEFDNRGGELGKPLPAGIIRVYGRDARGGAQFLGEDRIGHTAKGETLKIRLGEAFDITAERHQTAYRVLGEKMSESSYRIELRNAKDQAVTVQVREPVPGDWEITQESLRHRREPAGMATWEMTVPAGGAAVLDYTARIRW